MGMENINITRENSYRATLDNLLSIFNRYGHPTDEGNSFFNEVFEATINNFTFGYKSGMEEFLEPLHSTLDSLAERLDEIEKKK